MPQLAANRRTSISAAIRRASAAARREMNTLDGRVLGDLDRLYRQAAAELETSIRDYGGADGSIKLETLQTMLRQVYAQLDQLGAARDTMLDRGMVQAAQLGTHPFQGVVLDLTRVAHEALRFTRTFVAADGLQLSDRLWRIDAGARERIGQAIQSAVIQGHSASQAANEFLADGKPVPADIASKLGIANADAIARVSGAALVLDEVSARAQARRVFRTELNRAHGEAYRASAFNHPDVIGTRFLLSPAHPEPDICDMHARVNAYGLGPGVYPEGKSPWPAHPNTLSYEEAVFADEVTDEDKAGKEDRISWLKRQDPTVQTSVLRSRSKMAALRQGVLRESEIKTPWSVLKDKYLKRGIDITGAVRPSGSGVEPLADTSAVIIKTTVPRDFPQGNTLLAAGKITRQMMTHGRTYDYPKDADGNYLVRFRHGQRSDHPRVRAKLYNNASMTGLETKTANELNRALHETNQVADALGIPRLRGVNTAAGKAAASMGDGVLAVSKYNNRYFAPILSRQDAIKQIDHLITQKTAALERFESVYKGQTTASVTAARASYARDIEQLREKLKQLQGGSPVEVVMNPPSNWKPGSKESQPWTSDSFFSLGRDKFKTTVWHAFAHHIHQQLRVTNALEYKAPPLENTLAALYRRPDRLFPTRYSRTNHKEWFAESYSLYRMGRSDLVDADLLELIRKIESGGYTGA